MRLVISGVSSGIGKCTAEYFAEKGHTVYGISRRIVDIKGVISLSCDLTDDRAVEAAAKAVLKDGDIDCLINNAGMGISGAYETTPIEEVRAIFELNVIAGVKLTNAFLPSLKRTKGRIVNLSSVASVVPIPFQSFYAATKAAVDSLTYSLRMELKPFGVGVTAILPGDIQTGFTAARVKNLVEPTDYEGRIGRSVSKMERDEQNGMPPSAVTAAIAKAVFSKKSVPRIVVGRQYAFLAVLAERFGKKFREKIIYDMYAK